MQDAEENTSSRSHTKQFYGCECFYTNNYYLGQYRIHADYFNDDENFVSTYSELLRSKGCSNKADINEVIKQLNEEFKRRKTLHYDASKRIEQISASYIPSQLYVFKEEYLAKKFIDMVKSARRGNGDAVSRLVEKESADRVYRMPVFTLEFCKMLIEQLNHFENSDYPKGRPNTMNNSGILLEEFGFNEFITTLRMEYLNPISQILFPDWGGGELDSHKAFTVVYSEDRDLDLGFHYDNAEVTLNVSLGEEFDDGSLYFGSMRQDSKSSEEATEVKHRVCEGILHRGQHMHGAMPISYGVRHNLIIWMRSSGIRNRVCPMCDKKPKLIPLPRYGDGFTCETVEENAETMEICQLV